MAVKTISYTTAGNHWRWVGNYYQEVQVGQLVTMPEKGKITALKFKVAGLGPYYDPVYQDQQDTTHVAAAIWRQSDGAILAKSAEYVLDPENGGSQTWKTFDLPDTWVEAGADIIVGFWRIKTTTQYATQWDWNDSASGQTMVTHSIASSSDHGPVPFVISTTRPGDSINYEIDYIAGGHLKVYSRGSWYPAVPRVWNGSAWVDGVAKVWNGSSWVETS